MTAADNTARIQRLRFISFDKDDAKAEALAATLKAAEPPPPPPPPPPPTFSEKEVTTARNEGYAKGLNDGQAKAKAAVDQEAVERENADRMLLEVIANRITIAAEEHRAYRSTIEGQLGKLTMAVARKIAGEALKREPYAAAESLLKSCAALILGEERIIITVAPARAEGLRQRVSTIKPLLQGFEGELVVEEDDGIAEQDCRVSWNNGGAERNTDALWREMDAIIAKTPINMT